MTILNDGKPYHVAGLEAGVPPLWPEAKDGDQISIRNMTGTTVYKFARGEWYKMAWVPPPER